MSSSNTTPTDHLMDHFQGRGLKSIVIFTLIVHLVVILVTSIPFLIKEFSGPDEKLSAEQRTKLAVKEANKTLRDIAKSYQIPPQQLVNAMRGGRSAKPKQDSEPADTGNETPPADGKTPPADGSIEEPADGIRGDSDIENKLREKLPAPELPPVDDTDDLFK